MKKITKKQTKKSAAAAKRRSYGLLPTYVYTICSGGIILFIHSLAHVIIEGRPRRRRVSSTGHPSVGSVVHGNLLSDGLYFFSYHLEKKKKNKEEERVFFSFSLNVDDDIAPARARAPNNQLTCFSSSSSSRKLLSGSALEEEEDCVCDTLLETVFASCL